MTPGELERTGTPAQTTGEQRLRELLPEAQQGERSPFDLGPGYLEQDHRYPRTRNLPFGVRRTVPGPPTFGLPQR